MFVHTSMAECMSKVETTARLAQLRVDSLGSGSYRRSDPFKIGLWNWHLFIERKGSLTVRLYPENCRTSKEQVPIASFTVRVLVRGNDRQPLTCSGVTVSDKLLRGSDDFVWSVEFTMYAKFLLEVEFHDLKVASLNEAVCSALLKLSGQGTPPCALLLDPQILEGPLEWPLSQQGGEPHSIWSSEEHIQTQAQNGIARCLSRMLDEGLHTDVTIFTSSGSVGAHRAVLASRSPVFNSMFHHDLTEKQSSTVHINDMTLESCRALLRYLYGNLEHEEFQKHRAALVRASHKYDIPDLKDACEESLLEDIDVRNVLARLHDGWLYQLGRLKRECLRYLLEFGKIHDLREEFNEFLREVDKDLVVELVQEQLNLLKIHGF